MTEWITLAQAFGIPLTILAALAWFTARTFWPWLSNRLDAETKERHAERDRFLQVIEERGKRNDEERAEAAAERRRVVDSFLAAMDGRDKTHAEVIGKVSTAIDANTKVAEQITAAVEKNTLALEELKEKIETQARLIAGDDRRKMPDRRKET